MAQRVPPVLARFAVRILKGNPVVPADEAIVRFYKQGATVRTAISIPGNQSRTVDVFQFGVLALDEHVQVDADESSKLKVTALDEGARTLTLLNETSSQVDLVVGTRLVRTHNALDVEDPALIYDDPLGTTTGVGFKDADSDGWVTGYLKDFRYDYTTTGTGVTPAVYPDAEGSFVTR